MKWYQAVGVSVLVGGLFVLGCGIPDAGNATGTPDAGNTTGTPDAGWGTGGSTADLGLWTDVGGAQQNNDPDAIEDAVLPAPGPTLEPACVHIPNLVQAGEPAYIAVWAVDQPCLEYAGATVVVDEVARQIEVTLDRLLIESDECPPCSEPHFGLISLGELAPGPYQVRVGETFDGEMIASGGIIEEPNCENLCAEDTTLEGTTWGDLQIPLGTQQFDLACQPLWTESVSVAFQNACPEHELVPDLNGVWPFSTVVRQCSNDHLLFGEMAPYWVDATVCPTPASDGQRVILGVAQSTLDPTADQAFIMVER